MRKAAMEMKRDLVQMVLGLGVLVVMLVWQQGYFYILFWVILLAYLFNNLISKTGSASTGRSPGSRGGTSEFGLGAMHLAAGMRDPAGVRGLQARPVRHLPALLRRRAGDDDGHQLLQVQQAALQQEEELSPARSASS